MPSNTKAGNMHRPKGSISRTPKSSAASRARRNRVCLMLAAVRSNRAPGAAPNSQAGCSARVSGAYLAGTVAQASAQGAPNNSFAPTCLSSAQSIAVPTALMASGMDTPARQAAPVKSSSTAVSTWAVAGFEFNLADGVALLFACARRVLFMGECFSSRQSHGKVLNPPSNRVSKDSPGNPINMTKPRPCQPHG